MRHQFHLVYMLTRSDTVGGVQVHVRDLARSLISQGYAATVLVGGTGRFTEDLENYRVPYRSIPHLVREISPWHDWLALQETRAVLTELRPDLISTHTSKAGIVGRLAARSVGIPALFTAHGWAFTDGIPALSARVYCTLERYTASRCPGCIINVSEHDRQLAINSRVASPARLVTIHNGVPDIPRQWRANPAKQPPHLIMVARFASQKDHQTLLTALRQLTGKSWTLDFVGDGPKRAKIEQIVLGSGLANRIRFLGECSDVALHLARAQVFLLISRWEGFPRSTLEAMRAGLPVIVSDVGGAREAIEEGKTGYVVPRSDVATLTERLARLLDSPDLRERMGEAGRQRYTQEYTLEHVYARTQDIYRGIIDFAEEPAMAA